MLHIFRFIDIKYKQQTNLIMLPYNKYQSVISIIHRRNTIIFRNGPFCIISTFTFCTSCVLWCWYFINFSQVKFPILNFYLKSVINLLLLLKLMIHILLLSLINSFVIFLMLSKYWCSWFYSESHYRNRIVYSFILTARGTSCEWARLGDSCGAPSLLSLVSFSPLEINWRVLN